MYLTAASIPGQAATILVVTINPDTRSMRIAEALREAGLPCHVVGSRAEAVAAAECRAYDLVLLNMQSKTYLSLFLAQRLRNVQGYRRTPMLALTTSESVEHHVQLLNQGFDGFVVTPTHPERVCHAVRVLLDAPTAPTTHPHPMRTMWNQLRSVWNEMERNSLHPFARNACAA